MGEASKRHADNSSTGVSPALKGSRVEERMDDRDGLSSEVEEEPPKWARSMLMQIQKLGKKMDKVNSKVEESLAVAKEAKAEATAANQNATEA
eukprot:4518119-Karenia_brevis.AAC.1